jgi:hypothetical protein
MRKWLIVAAIMGAFMLIGVVCQHGPVYTRQHGMAEASAGLLVHHEAPVLRLMPHPSPSKGTHHVTGVVRGAFRVHRILRWILRPRLLPWWMRRSN